MYDIKMVQALNDQFRLSFVGGRIVITPGVGACDQLDRVLKAVRAFSAFSADTDPYGEHDFGALFVGSDQFFWKIDYYDVDMVGGSPDPSDPSVTTRVLTVMLASEY